MWNPEAAAGVAAAKSVAASSSRREQPPPPPPRGAATVVASSAAASAAASGGRPPARPPPSGTAAFYSNQGYDLHHPPRAAAAVVVQSGPPSSGSSDGGGRRPRRAAESAAAARSGSGTRGGSPLATPGGGGDRRNRRLPGGGGDGRRVFADPGEMIVIDYVDGMGGAPHPHAHHQQHPHQHVHHHPGSTRQQIYVGPRGGNNNYSPPESNNNPPQQRRQQPTVTLPDFPPSQAAATEVSIGGGGRLHQLHQYHYPHDARMLDYHHHHHRHQHFAQQQQQQMHLQQQQHQVNVSYSSSSSGYPSSHGSSGAAGPQQPRHLGHGPAQQQQQHPHRHHRHHHHHPHQHHPNHQASNRSSRSSDTSSAYSGSDTMQSVHSSLENEPVDLSGLHESVVDSDEEEEDGEGELADSVDSLAIRDLYRDCLEKDPSDRTAEDVEILLEFTQQLRAFCNFTLATRRALCAVMVFAVVEKAGTVVMNDGEELDSWSVIINGEVRIDDQPSSTNGKKGSSRSTDEPSTSSPPSPRFLRWGDAFGITPTTEKLYHRGVMRTCQDDCQFVCITQTDYYKILSEEQTNQRRFEDAEGRTVLVTEPDRSQQQQRQQQQLEQASAEQQQQHQPSSVVPPAVTHKVIRGTPDRLLARLVDEGSNSDATYVEDFLLTHRTFYAGASLAVAEKLLQWFGEDGAALCDRVTRVLLLWVHNHFTDFETDPAMMLFLERFESALESRGMSGQLRMLNFTCAEKARRRTLTLTRPSREEELQFALMGGYERGFGVFVEKVEAGSKASEVGLKRGDQILEVNQQSFEHGMTLTRAVEFLMKSTHLEICVKSNLLAIGDVERYKSPLAVLRRERQKQLKAKEKGHFIVHSLMFKEMLQAPENAHRARLRKASDMTGLRSSANDYNVAAAAKKRSAQEDPTASVSSASASSSMRSSRSHGSLLASSSSSGGGGHPPNSGGAPPAAAAAANLSGKEKVKAVLRGLLRPQPRSSSAVNVVDGGGGGDHFSNLDPHGRHSSDSWDFPPPDLPEHSLKIYKSDQSFKYLLVHHDTSARQVVMLALQEFGILECSSNFTLCEVTVEGEGGFVRQKRLPNDQCNLAERIGLGSRYYIKNILSSDQLIPEDGKSELTKESSVSLLQLNAVEVAVQLMVEDFTVFRAIEPTEYVDNLFGLESSRSGGTPNLDRFGDLVNTEMMWVITEVVSEPNAKRRANVVKQFIKVAHHCHKETQNYNSMFAITSGLDHGAVKRLKQTWEKVPGKYLKMLSEMQTLMDPSMNFRKYRNLLSNARPPFIPVYPMVCRDLTFIHLGNESNVEGLVNFEKLRMLAKEIRSLTNMCSAPLDIFTLMEQKQGGDFSHMRKLNPPQSSSASNSATMMRGGSGGGQANKRGGRDAPPNAKKMYEEAQMVRRVKAYLAKMPVVRDEDALHKMSTEVEPPPQQPNQASSSQGSLGAAAASSSAGNSLRAQTSVGSLGKSSTSSAPTSRPRLGSGQRGHSPTPSLNSNASSSAASQLSEGKSRGSVNSAGGGGVATMFVEAASDPRKTSHPGPPRPPRPRIARQASLSIDDLSKTMRQEDKTPATDLLTVPRPPSIESSARMSRSSLSLRRTTLPPNLDPKSYFAELSRKESVKVQRSKAAAAVLLESFGAKGSFRGGKEEKMRAIERLQRQEYHHKEETEEEESPAESSSSSDDDVETGTDSPQAVRKLMSLSEPPKTRRKNPNHNHHHSSGSTGSSNQQHDSKSPAAGRKQVTSTASASSAPPSSHHEESGAPSASSSSSSSAPNKKISLSKESSSVTSLPALRRATVAGSNSVSTGSLSGAAAAAAAVGAGRRNHHHKSLPRRLPEGSASSSAGADPGPQSSGSQSGSAGIIHRIPKAKLGRTQSREREREQRRKEEAADEEEETQVSAV